MNTSNKEWVKKPFKQNAYSQKSVNSNYSHRSGSGSYSGYHNYPYKSTNHRTKFAPKSRKPSDQASSSIKSVSELFHVLLDQTDPKPEIKLTKNLLRSSSEKLEKNEICLEKELLDPTSISCSLFDDSQSDSWFSENAEGSSENYESELSSDLVNEEDFDEQEISEQCSKQSKVQNKQEYIKYLNSVQTPLFGNIEICEEQEVPIESMQSDGKTCKLFCSKKLIIL